MEEQQSPKKRIGSAGRRCVSPSTKRAKARARLKKHRATHPQLKTNLVRLSTAVSRRWLKLANELRMDNNSLATLLLDMFDDDTVTSPVTLKLPSIPTPAGLTHGLTSSTDASVDNKMDGDFVSIKEQQQEDEDVDLDDSWEPVISHRNRKSFVGTTSKEVHEVHVTEDQSQDDEEDFSFSRPGLHRELQSPEGAEKTRFFIISETRLKDLAIEARPSCITCHQPVEVGVMPSGTSAHLSWKCGEGHISYFCCQETLQGTHLGDLQLASALVLSGNNYDKVLLMFNFMNLMMIHKKAFNACRQKYIYPVIKEKPSDLFKEARRKHIDKRLVLVFVEEDG